MIRVRSFACRAALLIVLCAVAGAAAAAPPETSSEAERWLEKLSDAVRERNYQGTFVYRNRNRIETLRIIHRADGDGEMERLYSLTGAAREVIRDNQKVTCILPDDRAVMVDHRQYGNPVSNVVPGDVAELSESYVLRMLGEDRIANRDAQQVGIEPRDGFRYGYQLWIDRETGLLLRADLFDEQGGAIEQLMFTHLETPDSIPTSALQPQISGEGFTWYEGSGKPQKLVRGERGWQIPGMPSGFGLVLHEVRALPGRERPVEHMLYSDGLATVSVYMEAGDPQDSFAGHSRVGAFNAYGRMVGGFQATVVGEVPAATVSRVGESIRREGSDR